MRVHLRQQQRNFGRDGANASAEKRFVAGLHVEPNGLKLKLTPINDGGGANVSAHTDFIPIARVLGLRLKDADVIVLHYVTRDEQDFYNFNVIATDLTFEDATQRSVGF